MKRYLLLALTYIVSMFVVIMCAFFLLDTVGKVNAQVMQSAMPIVALVGLFLSHQVANRLFPKK